MNSSISECWNKVSKQLANRIIVVLGDVMLDEFVWGDVTRISPEAPVPVVEIRRESVRLGGAANVLANIIALGARACVVGVVGRDRAGELLHRELQEVGALDGGEHLIADDERPTTIKTRIIAHNQLVVRADRESRQPIQPVTEKKLIDALQSALATADALVVSDYDKGAVTPNVLAKVLPFAHKRGTPVLVDPKIRNFDSYRPATLITPNHHEALKLSNTEDDSDAGIERAARILKERIRCSSVLVTRGERGMMLIEEANAPVSVATAAREVYDVTGAGDTVIATLAAAIGAGATLVEAATLANAAAGIVVGKVGTATVSQAELSRALEPKS